MAELLPEDCAVVEHCGSHLCFSFLCILSESPSLYLLSQKSSSPLEKTCSSAFLSPHREGVMERRKIWTLPFHSMLFFAEKFHLTRQVYSSSLPITIVSNSNLKREAASFPLRQMFLGWMQTLQSGPKDICCTSAALCFGSHKCPCSK